MIKTRFCSYGGHEKPLSQFGKYARSPDGMNPTCRVCRSEIRKKSEAKNPNRWARWHKKNPDYEAGRWQERKKKDVRTINALAANRNKEPEPCMVCGTSQLVEGHHPDYNDLDEIIWLCRRHHKQVHAGWTIEEMKETV